MATPDFSKIWGSAAESKYTFTDNDYVRGWQFIGSTPPSRTMFDAWMRMQDEKSQYLHGEVVNNQGLVDRRIIVSKTKPTKLDDEGLWVEPLE